MRVYKNCLEYFARKILSFFQSVFHNTGTYVGSQIRYLLYKRKHWCVSNNVNRTGYQTNPQNEYNKLSGTNGILPIVLKELKNAIV